MPARTPLTFENRGDYGDAVSEADEAENIVRPRPFWLS